MILANVCFCRSSLFTRPAERWVVRWLNQTLHFGFLFERKHHAVELDEKPLLYDYYANTLNPIIDRRNFEESDAHYSAKRNVDAGYDRYPKRFFLERSRSLPSVQEQQQKQQVIASKPCSPYTIHNFFVFFCQHNFREVADKGDYQEYMKRMLNDDRVVKRNFDEIDRFSLNRFVQTPYHWNSKRHLDEIDRFAMMPPAYTREEANNDVRENKKSY